MDNNVVLLPFALYGLNKFSKWWFEMIWQRKTDSYSSEDSWFVILLTPVLLMWVAMTFFVFTDKNYFQEMRLIYFLLTWFGPISLMMGFLRIFGFGYTSLGQRLGCYPPTIN